MNDQCVLMKKKEPQRRPRFEEGLSKYFYPEKIVSKKLLGDFKSKGSRGESLIQELFEMHINEISLVALVKYSRFLRNIFDIKLDRNTQRRKSLMIKWYDDNYDIIKENLKYVKLSFINET